MAAPYTTTLTYPSTITINSSDRVVEFSILAIGGNVNVTGTGSFQGISSTAAIIPSGTSQTFVYQTPIEGLTIAPASGASASIVLNF
jgi:hypothetical protein